MRPLFFEGGIMFIFLTSSVVFYTDLFSFWLDS